MIVAVGPRLHIAKIRTRQPEA